MALPEPTRLDPHGSATAFDRLREQRVVFLRGRLDEERAAELVAELLMLDSASDHDVTLLIDAAEGSFEAMLAVADVVAAMGALVHTRCVGTAGAAAAVLLATGTGSRSAARHARVVLGPPRGEAEGTGTELATEAEQTARLHERAAEILADRTGTPLDLVRADTERDRWLSAEEARDYGIVDSVG